MRAALCLFLLGSTALLSGCVDGGPSRGGLRYDDDGRYVRGGYASSRPPRDNGDRVPEYNEERRFSRAGSYERDMRVREERRDRSRPEETRRGNDVRDRDVRDRDVRDRSNPPRDRDRNGQNRDDGRDPVCEYPCIR